MFGVVYLLNIRCDQTPMLEGLSVFKTYEEAVNKAEELKLSYFREFVFGDDDFTDEDMYEVEEGDGCISMFGNDDVDGYIYIREI